MTTTPYTILYVDDEEMNLLVFSSTFRREFKILLAKSAMQGIEILENNAVDVVITDQRMPEMTGVEFLKEVNTRFPNIPPGRLIVSGYASNDEIEEAFQSYHLFKFISKPWNVVELRSIILQSIEERHGK